MSGEEAWFGENGEDAEPLASLLADPDISDILVNGHKTIYIERHGRLELTGLRFHNVQHLYRVIQRIAAAMGRHIDERSPMVDARLRDGSRVNAVVPPLSVDGPALSIRRFGRDPLRIEDLLQAGALTDGMRQFLDAGVRARLNVLVSGGTGTGKTTLLNALSSFIPSHERILTIEDAAELRLQKPHVVRMETRPPDLDGQGEVTARDLVRNSLRMRPDRILVGEVRSGEVFDMLQAMNTGHEGSMATVHANTPRDALNRLVAMVGLSGLTLSEALTLQLIARAINLVVQLQRGSDGVRRIAVISEITGIEGAMIQMQDLFVWKQQGVDKQGRAIGQFSASGVRPRCLERLERSGMALDAALFRPGPSR